MSVLVPVIGYRQTCAFVTLEISNVFFFSFKCLMVGIEECGGKIFLCSFILSYFDNFWVLF